MSVNMAEGIVVTNRDFKYVVIWSAILLTSILFVHNVATVYAGNVEEFQFQLVHFFIFSVPLFLVNALVLAGPAIYLRREALKIYASGISFLAILAWLYSNFIVFDFGLLDGQDIRFQIAEDYELIEIAGIVVCAFLCGFLMVEKPRILSFFLICVNLVLLIPTGWAVATDSKYATPGTAPQFERGLPIFGAAERHCCFDGCFSIRPIRGSVARRPEAVKTIDGVYFFSEHARGRANDIFDYAFGPHGGAIHEQSHTTRSVPERGATGLIPECLGSRRA